VSWLGLLGEVAFGFAAETTGCSFLDALINVSAICLGQTGDEHHSKVHSEEVDVFDFSGGEFRVGTDHIHEVDVVFSLWFGHSSFIEFDGGIDGSKEFAHGCDQLGFAVKVGEFGGGVFQDWLGSAGHELPPVHGDAKQQVDVAGSSPVFDEELDLLEAL
jgi:hypothetical protein